MFHACSTSVKHKECTFAVGMVFEALLALGPCPAAVIISCLSPTVHIVIKVTTT